MHTHVHRRAHTCARAQGHTGPGTLVQQGEQLPCTLGLIDGHVLNDYQSVVACEAQTPISGAFESIGSLEGKQKRLKLA